MPTTGDRVFDEEFGGFETAPTADAPHVSLYNGHKLPPTAGMVKAVPDPDGCLNGGVVRPRCKRDGGGGEVSQSQLPDGKASPTGKEGPASTLALPSFMAPSPSHPLLHGVRQPGTLELSDKSPRRPPVAERRKERVVAYAVPAPACRLVRPLFTSGGVDEGALGDLEQQRQREDYPCRLMLDQALSVLGAARLDILARNDDTIPASSPGPDCFGSCIVEPRLGLGNATSSYVQDVLNELNFIPPFEGRPPDHSNEDDVREFLSQPAESLAAVLRRSALQNADVGLNAH